MPVDGFYDGFKNCQSGVRILNDAANGTSQGCHSPGKTRSRAEYSARLLVQYSISIFDLFTSTLDAKTARAGFEPATGRLTADCSTTELPGKTYPIYRICARVASAPRPAASTPDRVRGTAKKSRGNRMRIFEEEKSEKVVRIPGGSESFGF